MKFNRTILVPLALMIFVVAMRVMPYLMIASKHGESTPGNQFYPWNFSPMTAACLLLGSYFGNRRSAYLATLLMMFLSDLATGWGMGNLEFAFHSLIPFTYGCTLISTWLGTFLHNRRTLLRGVSAATIAEVIFFVVTNAGNWLLMPTQPQTLTGLIATYIDAIPFYKNELIGTTVYGLCFYGLAVLADHLPVASRQTAVGTSE